MKLTTIILFLIVSAATVFAGATSPLPFKTMIMKTDVGQPYGMATITIECSSLEDNYSRQITSLKIKTKNKEYVAPNSIISKFRNPQGILIHGGIDAPEVNFIFDYEWKPYSFRGGYIQFKKGIFKIYEMK